MKQIKYALYARKSTESEDRQVQSIEDQIDEMTKLAKCNNWVIEAIFEESKSAKDPYKRPEFNRMLEMIDDKIINGVICWQVNRLSRNPTESGILQQKLQDEAIMAIQTYDKVFRPGDNAIVFSVESSTSNQFILDLQKNVKRGIAKKVRDGGHSGVAPGGYINNRLEKTIELDPIRSPLIREAFDMFLRGWSVQQIRRTLNDDRGYLTIKRKRNGGKPLSYSAMYYILRNPRYAGKSPDPFGSEEMYDTNYPAIITQDEYDKVQDLLGDKGRPRLVKSKFFALKGLVKCGECGCSITAEQKTKKLASGLDKHYIYYHCTHKRPCSQRLNISEDDLFEQVDSLLSQYEISPKLYEWGMEAIAEIAKEEKGKINSTRKMQNYSINEIQSQLDNLIDLTAQGFITAEKFGEKSSPLQERLKKLQIAQEEHNGVTSEWYEVISQTIKLLNGASSKFVNGDILDKKQILMAIGSKPLLIDGKLVLEPHKWLIPIKENASILVSQINKVRTTTEQVKNGSNQVNYITWYPGLGSNQRP